MLLVYCAVVVSGFEFEDGILIVLLFTRYNIACVDGCGLDLLCCALLLIVLRYFVVCALRWMGWLAVVCVLLVWLVFGWCLLDCFWVGVCSGVCAVVALFCCGFGVWMLF